MTISASLSNWVIISLARKRAARVRTYYGSKLWTVRGTDATGQTYHHTVQ